MRPRTSDSAQRCLKSSLRNQLPGDEGDSSEPPLLLADSWDNSRDLSGWWMSEKLDGVRAYWDGQQFFSRQGDLYKHTDWFADGLPRHSLTVSFGLIERRFSELSVSSGVRIRANNGRAFGSSYLMLRRNAVHLKIAWDI